VSLVTDELGSYITEDDILHSHCREKLKSYIALTGWALERRCNVSPVKYELGLYITEDDILHSNCREELKSYIDLLSLNESFKSTNVAVSYYLNDGVANHETILTDLPTILQN
jgi:hypothetical protein